MYLAAASTSTLACFLRKITYYHIFLIPPIGYPPVKTCLIQQCHTAWLCPWHCHGSAHGAAVALPCRAIAGPWQDHGSDMAVSMARDEQIAGIFVNAWVNPYPFSYPWQQKNDMGTMNTHILTIDCAHDILPPPQKTMAALNGISSETGLRKVPCSPWHLGRAQAWARAQGCPGPVPRPARQPLAQAQAWARPKCHGPHGTFRRPVSELIPFRADMVFRGGGRMPWAPSMLKI